MDRITLIITKEAPKLNEKLSYFYDKGYLAIEFQDCGIDSFEVEKLSTNFNHFDDIFNTFIKDYFTEDGINLDDEYYNDLDWNYDDEKISLVEFIKRLQLSTFIIYHVTYFDFGVTSHLVCFENKEILENSNFEKAWKKSNFDIWKGQKIAHETFYKKK